MKKTLLASALFLCGTRLMALDLSAPLPPVNNEPAQAPAAFVCMPGLDTMLDCEVIGFNVPTSVAGIGEITFKEVLEDSRCPVSVNCFWAGQVRLKFGVVTEFGETKEIELGFGDGFSTIYQTGEMDEGFEIELLEVTPRSFSLLPEQYQVKLALKPASGM